MKKSINWFRGLWIFTQNFFLGFRFLIYIQIWSFPGWDEFMFEKFLAQRNFNPACLGYGLDIDARGHAVAAKWPHFWFWVFCCCYSPIESRRSFFTLTLQISSWLRWAMNFHLFKTLVQLFFTGLHIGCFDCAQFWHWFTIRIWRFTYTKFVVFWGQIILRRIRWWRIYVCYVWNLNIIFLWNYFLCMFWQNFFDLVFLHYFRFWGGLVCVNLHIWLSKLGLTFNCFTFCVADHFFIIDFPLWWTFKYTFWLYKLGDKSILVIKVIHFWIK